MKEKKKSDLKRTTKLTDEIYKAVLRKQVDLLDAGIDMSLQEIVQDAVKKGLDLVGDDTLSEAVRLYVAKRKKSDNKTKD